MPLATIRRITERLRKAASVPAEFAPVSRPPAPRAELAGSFRLKDGPRLRAHLFGLLQRGARVIALDCSRVALMDGCGLAVLLEFIAACRDSAVRLRLVEPSRRMMDAFALYGIRGAIESIAEYRLPELDTMLVILEDDFDGDLSLPAAA